ncbi:TatD family hydrolase [bacterium]|nr:TatD family hydrolase [bacterium]
MPERGAGGAPEPQAASPVRSGVFTDTHAHLALVEERLGRVVVEAVLERYAEAGAAAEGGRSGAGAVSAPFIVDIGVNPGDLAPRLAGFGAYPFLRFAAGLWPGRESLGDPEAALAALAADLASPRCAALGECGLDYHHMEASERAQIELFEAQAAMAAQAGLPLLVHSREAFADTLAVAGGVAGKIPVVIHCFGYGAREAAAFLECGCHLSFAGNLTYRKSDGLREALAAAPSDRILFETDSPYMNPMPHRGKPSTSLDLARTMAAAAEIRGVALEELAAAAQANAIRIFSGKKS